MPTTRLPTRKVWIACLSAAAVLAPGCVAGGGTTGSGTAAAADTGLTGADGTATGSADATTGADSAADTAGTADTTTAADTAAPVDVPAAEVAECLNEKLSKSAMFKVCLEGPMTLKGGQNGAYTATIIAADASTPVPLPSVKFIHVQMGHGGSKVPAISQIGDSNQYTITNIVPSMSGGWRLSLTFAKGDDAAWDIPVK